jgi:hypothetical protein
MKNTGASSIVCFTILVLPVLLDEEYYKTPDLGQITGKLYNTSITSIVGVLRKLGTGTYTGLNQLVCMHDVSEFCVLYNTSITSIAG